VTGDPGPAPVRLLVVEDHGLTRLGIRATLEAEPGLVVVGEAADGVEGLRLARELEPDVALLDLSLPRLSGLEVARRLADDAGPCRVVMVTMHAEPELVHGALSAGVVGYLVKTDAAEKLADCVRAVAHGIPWFSESILRHVVSRAVGRERGRSPAGDPLSARETEVLGLIARGRSSKEIAGQLGLSVRTIDTHRVRLMRKLGLHDIASLTRYALAMGLAGLS
jgi:DNA-binding NarL/FixJ family response regulator